jgi:hypothetical protein
MHFGKISDTGESQKGIGEDEDNEELNENK